jgi:hypothetical protein
VEQDRHSTILDTVIAYKSKAVPRLNGYLPTYLAQRSRISHGVAQKNLQVPRLRVHNSIESSVDRASEKLVRIPGTYAKHNAADSDFCRILKYAKKILICICGELASMWKHWHQRQPEIGWLACETPRHF